MPHRIVGPIVGRVIVITVLVSLLSAGWLGCTQDMTGEPQLPAASPAHHQGEDLKKTTIPGAGILPFPASEAEKIWPVGPDKTLIAHRWTDSDVSYWLAAGGDCTAIVGAISKAEVRSVSPTSVEFVCHGINDTAFIAFPYLLIYDVATGKTEESPLSLDPQQPVEFGFPGIKKGQVLMSIGLNEDDVELQFGTAPGMLQTFSGPISYIPYTVSQWDKERGGLALRLTATELEPAVPDQVDDLAGGYLQGVVLERLGDDVVLLLRVDEPRHYYITHTQGDRCLMTVHFAP